MDIHLGSSPLTRGKQASPRSSRKKIGLIPAHAGKTNTRRPRSAPGRAHPRSRGENTRRPAFRSPAKGSSPLTRGKRRLQQERDVQERLIPAHAGKTSPQRISRYSRWAHPRSRGENPTSRQRGKASRGSSPLTRGKHVGHADRLASSGLIPAHAGKTPPPHRPGWTRPAHPRSRGENVPFARSPLHGSGSSPLTRGKPSPDVRAMIDTGLIPAHAGKTVEANGRAARDEAHPRSRGENERMTGDRPKLAGSSPLTRGKRRWRGRGRAVPGLIPAHAGKTSGPLLIMACRGAHPRSRGENHLVRLEGHRHVGSSPLTRGKHQSRRECCGRMGLIPAHAGKTPAPDGRLDTDRAHPRSRGENAVVAARV